VTRARLPLDIAHERHWASSKITQGSASDILREFIFRVSVVAHWHPLINLVVNHTPMVLFVTNFHTET